MAKEKKTTESSVRKLRDEQQATWFDKHSSSRKDLLCILVLLVATYALFHDIALKNMIFSTEGDNAAARSFQVAGDHINETEKVEPLWIPYVFSGMPGFGSLAYVPIDVSYVQRVAHLIGRGLFLNADMSWMVMHYFIAALCMFLLARSWKFTHLPSLLAALVFMLAPYAIGLAPHGHGSKLMALSYIPLLLLLTHSLLERRDVLSLGLLAAAIGTELLTNHVQIVYYGFMLIGLYALHHIAWDSRTPAVQRLKGALLFAGALVIGFAISSYIYLTLNEYAQYSIRGGGGAGLPGGLTYDYATNWSFHPWETLNYLLPSFFGFQTPYYWGWMPFTESTAYIGVVPIFLSIFAFNYRRNQQVIFLGLFSFLILIISFGKHFFFYDLLFNYLPYFNKFRAPSMILHLMPLTFGMLAAIGLSALIDLRDSLKESDFARLRKKLIIAAAIIGTVLVIGFLGKGAIYETLSGFMFQRDDDLAQLQQQYGAQAPQVLQQLKSIRFDMLWKDYVKFALIAGVIIGSTLLFFKRSIRPVMYSAILISILVIDLLMIDLDFIDPKPSTAMESRFAPDATVRFLKTDTSLYRVFPVGGLFQDNTWMYHTVQSIGGYSPAKIRIYQEMIDSCLYRGPDPTFPLNMNIVNMLNVKYIIAPGRLPEDRFHPAHADESKGVLTYANPSFLPRAWFVEGAIVASNKTEVFNRLNARDFDPRHTAIIEKQTASTFAHPDSAVATLITSESRRIVVQTYSSHPALLVLSEVYYPAGWKAFVDGTETEIYKTNYILRSVVVPAGTHSVEFRFDPPTYATGLMLSHVGWGLALLLVAAGLFRHPGFRTRFLDRRKPAT